MLTVLYSAASIEGSAKKSGYGADVAMARSILMIQEAVVEQVDSTTDLWTGCWANRFSTKDNMLQVDATAQKSKALRLNLELTFAWLCKRLRICMT